MPTTTVFHGAFPPGCMALHRALLLLLLLTAGLAGCADDSPDAGGDGADGGDGSDGSGGGSGDGSGDESGDGSGQGNSTSDAPGEPFDMTCNAEVGAGAEGNSLSIPIPPIGGTDPVASVGGCSMGNLPSDAKATAITMPNGCRTYLENDDSNTFTDGEVEVGKKYDSGDQVGMYCDSGVVQATGTISFLTI